VTIIVPARNEERNIRRCVTSLLEQDYPACEVLVVNDGSTDRTAAVLAELAASHPQGAKLRVLHLDDLPPGWAGKPHALHAGVQASQSDFLLFTDADTWHAPRSLRLAVARACEYGRDMLSLSTEQELPTFWERVLMPMAFLGISMQYPIDQVNDPRSPLALANGQYILLRRVVYEETGGYARADMRQTLLDDRDLARLVKQAGYRLELVDGRDLVHVRMYHNLAETWRGWRKNAFLGSRGGIPFAWLSRLSDRNKILRIREISGLSALELLPLLAYRRWIDRELRVPWYYSLTHPLAGLLFTGILAQSMWRVLTHRGVDWRGRHYFKDQ
jgi:chlorobactene glucosyltransferase